MNRGRQKPCKGKGNAEQKIGKMFYSCLHKIFPNNKNLNKIYNSNVLNCFTGETKGDHRVN